MVRLVLKAHGGRKGLVAKKVQITRGGKTFMQTVYVKTDKKNAQRIVDSSGKVSYWDRKGLEGSKERKLTSSQMEVINATVDNNMQNFVFFQKNTQDKIKRLAKDGYVKISKKGNISATAKGKKVVTESKAKDAKKAERLTNKQWKRMSKLGAYGAFDDKKVLKKILKDQELEKDIDLDDVEQAWTEIWDMVFKPVFGSDDYESAKDMVEGYFGNYIKKYKI